MEDVFRGDAEDVVLVGTLDAIRSRLERWAELGVTDVVFAPFALPGDPQASLVNTRNALASINANGGLR